MKTFTKNINRISVENEQLNRAVFSLAVSVFILASVFYVFFLGRTVFNLVQRKNIENEARTIVSRVGELELEYLSLAGQINPEFAKSKGFKDPVAQGFAAKNGLTRSLSLNSKTLNDGI